MVPKVMGLDKETLEWMEECPQIQLHMSLCTDTLERQPSEERGNKMGSIILFLTIAYQYKEIVK